ncbi:C39 family peptidase [Bariatricus sp. SGI.154]|uniref:C39 family peptidase n=1 Tax=Bariatricus sp. SGI.154 TaxID=3420549 RepID=UPI003D017C25
MSNNRRRNSRRKQQVRRQLLLLGMIVILIVSALVCCHIRRNKKEALAGASKIEQRDETKKAVDKTESIETDAQRVERVKKEVRSKGCPTSVIELLDKNEETLDFVEDYEEKKDLPSADTIGEDLVEGQIPKLYQWDERWGYAGYGTSIVAVSGCGPTCMAMVAAGLTNDASITPAKVAAYGTEHQYIDENNDTYWRFMNEVGANWNLSCYDGQLTEDQVRAELNAGHPIICSVGPGDFTQNGHFIVLTGYKDGSVTINDPFSRKNSSQPWVYDEIADQIKAMWVYSVR